MLFRKRRREDSSSLSNGRSIGSVPRQHRDFGCGLTGAECDLARIHARPAQSIGFAFDGHDSPLHRMVILRRGSEVKTVLSAVRFFDNWALLFRTTPSPQSTTLCPWESVIESNGGSQHEEYACTDRAPLNLGILIFVVSHHTASVQASGSEQVVRGRELEIVDGHGKVRASISVIPGAQRTGPTVPLRTMERYTRKQCSFD